MLLGNLFPFAGQLGLSIAVQTSVTMLMYLCKVSDDEASRATQQMWIFILSISRHQRSTYLETVVDLLASGAMLDIIIQAVQSA